MDSLLQAKALNAASIGSLCMVVLGAMGYVLSDKGFQVKNMAWVFAYGLANAAYPIVTKLVIKSNSMTSWGRTYYNNLMTFIVFIPVAFINGEHTKLLEIHDKGSDDFSSMMLLFLSCVWGTAISFLGFLVLENITATTFNVMGNANKLLTLVVNHVLWEHHASLQVRARWWAAWVGGWACRRMSLQDVLLLTQYSC